MSIVIFPKEYILNEGIENDVGIQVNDIVQIFKRPLANITDVEYYKETDTPAILSVDLKLSEVCVMVANAEEQ